MTLQLEPRSTTIGAETRLLLAECKGPSFSGYTLASATESMQLMDLVLFNRLKNNPGQFGAKHARTIIDIIKAPNQFHGFESYPNYSGAIANNIQSILNIANSSTDPRSADFSDFVSAAIDVATQATIADPSGGILAAWRKKASGSPGSNFVFFKTVGGNEFYRLK
jgi:hypothetical protein